MHTQGVRICSLADVEQETGENDAREPVQYNTDQVSVAELGESRRYTHETEKKPKPSNACGRNE